MLEGKQLKHLQTITLYINISVLSCHAHWEIFLKDPFLIDQYLKKV